MTSEEDTLIKLPTEEEPNYAYIVKAKDKTIWLKIKDEDVFTNADGELDCPIDRVLRKNGYSIYDLLSWTAHEIEFVTTADGVVTSLRKIPFNETL